MFRPSSYFILYRAESQMARRELGVSLTPSWGCRSGHGSPRRAALGDFEEAPISLRNRRSQSPLGDDQVPATESLV